MSSIDERVVAMKFDNAQFQKGVSDTNKSLGDLKQGLNLDGAAKSLQGLDAAGKNFSLAGMASGVEAMASKFSALSILGITALVNIGNQAVNTGIALVKSLTIDPIADGFSDYNAKLTSVQTIMNATGASIEEVSGYFSQLDVYADKTIYNLTDMTGAFAKFTNAGVGMDKSVPAIKGIANMVALAGQDAGAASIAMYNLSQSIAGGFLTTTDYKSLNLANVATKEWKDQMIAGAEAAGTLEKTAEGTYHILGTKADAASTSAELFNDNLKDGWATTEVMMKVLGDYGDTNTEIGKKAQAAAQDVKSFGMMMETLKAGVGTGWTDTFEILVGNLHEAKALFTPLTTTIGGFFEEMSTARNNFLKEWKDMGGRTFAIDAVKNSFHALMDIIKPITEAFREIFPPSTGHQLADITMRLRDFTAKLKPSQQTIDNVKRTAKGLFAVFDIGWLILQKVWGVFSRLIKTTDGAGQGILGITAKIGDFLLKIRDTLVNSERLNNFFIKFGDILVGLVNKVKAFANSDMMNAFLTKARALLSSATDKLKEFGHWLGTTSDKIGEFFKNFKGPDTSGFTGAVDNLKASVGKLQPAGDVIAKIWNGLIEIFKKAMEIGKSLAGELGKAFGGFGDMLASGMKIDFNAILGILGTGLLGGIAVLIKKIYDRIKNGAENDSPSLFSSIKDAIGGLTETLSAMQQSLKAGTLLMIAGAIALLTVSVVALSKVDPVKLGAALAAMTIMFVQLSAAMAVLSKMTVGASMAKLVLLGGALILIAIAIRILAGAVAKLAENDWQQLAKGLTGVIALLGGLAGAMRLMPKNPTGMIATGIGMIALAVAIKILASAVGDFAGMDWQKMMQGLIGVGIVLGGLALFTQVAKVNKGAVGQAAGLILLGIAIKIMASAVLDFANMNVATIQQGLGALTGVLAALAIFSRVVNPSGMVSMGIAMVILGGAMKIMASAITDLGNIPWEIMGRGLAGMAGALVGVGVAMRLMPPNMLLSAAALAVVAGSLLIMSDVLKKMGGMSWEEIGKGLVVLSGSLLILAGAMYLMSGAIPGALALLIVVGALTLLVPVLQALGGMSWETIGTGLGALAATLGVLAVAGIVLGVLSPLFALFGASLILVGAGALLAGVGLLAFSVGITALAAAGAVGTTVLIGMIMGLAAMLPAIMVQVGLALVAFAQVIIDSAPKFGEAFMVILKTILDIIVQMSPPIIDTLWGLIVLLVEKVVEGIPYLVDAGMRLIIGILDGISNNIGKVIDAGANLVIEFLNGLGRNVQRVTDAAADMIIKFVNGLATTIETKSQEMRDAGGKLAFAIIDGMTGGLASKAKEVWDGAANIGRDAINAIKGAIDSNSPSKETFKLGNYTSQGFAMGMTSLSGLVGKSATGVGETALTSLTNAVSGIGAALSEDMDMNPTIRPVLDLSAIKKDSSLIGGMITPPSLAIEGSYAKASTLAISARANQDTEAISKSDTTPMAGAKIELTQINHSPKALSTIEIYRNTNNQISTLKGLVEQHVR